MGKKVTIIGDGGWGTALALVLCRNGHAVTIWGPSEDYLGQIREAGVNHRYLPGVALPGNLGWTAEPALAARRAEAVILAVPSRFYAGVCKKFHRFIPATADLLSVTKGLCGRPHERMSRLAGELLERETIAVLSGPSHAEEVARGIPTAVVVSSPASGQARMFQQMFGNSRFRVYTSGDPVGVELGGALKNIIALAVGVSDGLGFGDNTRAALITRGLAEISRLGVAMGARAETFAGLSGMGDLVVTCTSRHSRNRAFGERVGRGETPRQILDHMQMEAEGPRNCAVALSMAERLGIETPIIEQTAALLEGRTSPQDAMTSLMERDLKAE